MHDRAKVVEEMDRAEDFAQAAIDDASGTFERVIAAENMNP